jgi:hypothetical protein
MSPRQARRERREAERKAKKAELKRAKAAAASELNSAPVPDVADPELEQEFSPEFIAHARSVRERIERRAAAERFSTVGFVSHTADVPTSLTRSRERSDRLRLDEAASLSEPKTRMDEAACLSEPKTPANLGFVSQNAPNPIRSRAEINRQNAEHSTGPAQPAANSLRLVTR